MRHAWCPAPPHSTPPHPEASGARRAGLGRKSSCSQRPWRCRPPAAAARIGSFRRRDGFNQSPARPAGRPRPAGARACVRAKAGGGLPSPGAQLERALALSNLRFPLASVLPFTRRWRTPGEGVATGWGERTRGVDAGARPLPRNGSGGGRAQRAARRREGGGESRWGLWPRPAGPALPQAPPPELKPPGSFRTPHCKTGRPRRPQPPASLSAPSDRPPTGRATRPLVVSCSPRGPVSPARPSPAPATRAPHLPPRFPLQFPFSAPNLFCIFPFCPFCLYRSSF